MVSFFPEIPTYKRLLCACPALLDGFIFRVNASVVDVTNHEKLGRCGCVPQSGCPALVPKAHGVIRGRAPSAVRCEILF